MTLIPAPAYALARAAWIRLVIRHADGRFTRLEGEPRADYAAALAASGRPARTDIRDRGDAARDTAQRRGWKARLVRRRAPVCPHPERGPADGAADPSRTMTPPETMTRPRRLAAMLRPDHARARRDDAPEATDVGAPAVRAEAPPGLWGPDGNGRPLALVDAPQTTGRTKPDAEGGETPVASTEDPGGRRAQTIRTAGGSKVRRVNLRGRAPKLNHILVEGEGRGWLARSPRSRRRDTDARASRAAQTRPAVSSHSAPIGPSG